MEKLKTGGTAPPLNNDDACKIVPSPPSVITRSIFSESGPGDHTLTPLGKSGLSSPKILRVGCRSRMCRRNASNASMTGGVRSLFTKRMLFGGSMVLGCGAPVVPNASPGDDLNTRFDQNCLKLHRGKHERDGLKSECRPVSHRRWGVVVVRVLVRKDANIAGQIPVPSPGIDLE